MSSCFGYRKKPKSSEEHNPLLPQYNDDAALQRRVHQKLHTYQMIRALSKGFMPSTEQVISNLRSLLASDLFKAETTVLSDSGCLLLRYSKQWLSESIELLRNKNNGDQIQDFIWSLSHARLSIDANNIVRTASSTRAKADASAAYESIKTVGSLLLTSSDFHLFLSDLNTIGRQVFADTANTLSEVTEDAAKQIKPSAGKSEVVKNPDWNHDPPPAMKDLGHEVYEVSDVIVNGLKKTGQAANTSLRDNVTKERKGALFHLKTAIAKLRKRNDYSGSVSTIGLLIQRYAKLYSRAIDKTISTFQEDIGINEELDRAVENGWTLLSLFGDKAAWKELEQCFNRVIRHSQKDPEFEAIMSELAVYIQKALADPEFVDPVGDGFDKVGGKLKETGSESSLRHDIDRFTQQAWITFGSVLNDQYVSKLLKTTLRIWSILFPVNATVNTELFADAYTFFVPILIQTIQYIPIPRLEVSVPEIDLLFENLIIEPGRTVNNSSFLPFKLNIKTYNDLTIRKARMRTVSNLTTLVTLNIQGLSIHADEIGFWLRAHKGPLRLADEGIVSFEIDDRGIDIALDAEVGKNYLEKIVSLRDVRVKIHHFNYTLSKSKFACLSRVFKPLLRLVIRKVLERQLRTAIADALHAVNRELLYARERLRATRISDPQDLTTFIKAVITRMTPEENPDRYTNIGITGASNVKGNVFADIYTPGSVVKLWRDEAARAGERVEDNFVQGWRSEIFDLQAGAIQ